MNFQVQEEVEQPQLDLLHHHGHQIVQEVQEELELQIVFQVQQYPTQEVVVEKVKHLLLMVQEELVEEEMQVVVILIEVEQLIPEEEVEQVIQMEVVEVQESLLLDILQEQHQL